MEGTESVLREDRTIHYLVQARIPHVRLTVEILRVVFYDGPQRTKNVPSHKRSFFTFTSTGSSNSAAKSRGFPGIGDDERAGVCDELVSSSRPRITADDHPAGSEKHTRSAAD